MSMTEQNVEERYEDEVQPYWKADYKPIIYIIKLNYICDADKVDGPLDWWYFICRIYESSSLVCFLLGCLL